MMPRDWFWYEKTVGGSEGDKKLPKRKEKRYKKEKNEKKRKKKDKIRNVFLMLGCEEGA